MGLPSSSGNTVPVPVSSKGASSVWTYGTISPSIGSVGPETNSEPGPTPPTAVITALTMPLSSQNFSMASWRTSPSVRRRTNALPR